MANFERAETIPEIQDATVAAERRRAGRSIASEHYLLIQVRINKGPILIHFLLASTPIARLAEEMTYGGRGSRSFISPDGERITVYGRII